MPRVTEPPAEHRPPEKRPTTIVTKFGARAQGICQTLTRNSESCMMGHRPSSSEKGAQSCGCTVSLKQPGGDHAAHFAAKCISEDAIQP